MGKINLSSGPLRIRSVLKKTNATLFNNLEKGDHIEITVPVERAGVSRGRSYSVALMIRNLSTGESVLKTFNEISSILNCFDIEVLEPVEAPDAKG